MIRLLLLACFSLFCLEGKNLSAQVLGLELLDNNESVELNFDYNQGFILLDVKFNRSLPLKFILDTGAEHIILFKKEISDLLGMPYEKRINLVGSDLNRQVYAYICRNVALSLKNTPTVERDIIVLEEDFLHLEELTGKPIHGIIGSRFFRGLVMELDYKKSRLVLHDGSLFRPPAKFKQFDLSIEKHKPYLSAQINTESGDSIPLKLLLDTGAALPFLLFLDTHPSLEIPDYFVKGNLGKGLGGDIEGYLSKVNDLELFGSYNFSNLVTSFQELGQDIDPDILMNRNGLIGNPILERFKLIIDFVNSKIYLQARKNYNKEFEYDKSGLVIYAFGADLDNYYIKDVIVDSPAYEAGIRRGDMIKRIGLWPANFYSLGHILKKLKGRDGKRIKMHLERNGVRYKTSFILRDFLSPRQEKNP